MTGEQMLTLQQAVAGANTATIRNLAHEWRTGSESLTETVDAMRKAAPEAKHNFGGQTGASAEAAYVRLQTKLGDQADDLMSGSKALVSAADAIDKAVSQVGSFNSSVPTEPSAPKADPDAKPEQTLKKEAAYQQARSKYQATMQARDASAASAMGDLRSALVAATAVMNSMVAKHGSRSSSSSSKSVVDTAPGVVAGREDASVTRTSRGNLGYIGKPPVKVNPTGPVVLPPVEPNVPVDYVPPVDVDPTDPTDHDFLNPPVVDDGNNYYPVTPGDDDGYNEWERIGDVGPGGLSGPGGGTLNAGLGAGLGAAGLGLGGVLTTNVLSGKIPALSSLLNRGVSNAPRSMLPVSATGTAGAAGSRSGMMAGGVMGGRGGAGAGAGRGGAKRSKRRGRKKAAELFAEEAWTDDEEGGPGVLR